ncbi:UNVERIFIED_CONTAM: hypothetical protein Slati_2511600 [Sesamum latifolium]|uniref:Uncharacterized protein n=1 Tax=Sesamum latifolium TaxID=2727402 RepID=A0AAW2WGF7_9LAMI
MPFKERSDDLHFLLESSNVDPYDCQALIDEKLLGHFGLSPDRAPGIPWFGKLLRNQSGNRGGGTPPPRSPRETPPPHDSKGKRPATAPPSATLGGSSEKSRPAPKYLPSGSSRPSLGLPPPPPVKDERGVPLRTSLASSDSLHSFSTLEAERGGNLSLVQSLMRGILSRLTNSCCSSISRGAGRVAPPSYLRYPLGLLLCSLVFLRISDFFDFTGGFCMRGALFPSPGGAFGV